MIRDVKDGDFEKQVRLYRSFFSTHNIFQKSEEEIIAYLKDKSQEDDLIVYDDGSLKGALFLVNFGENIDGSHRLWKFRHFAYESEEIASHILEEAERRVKESSETSKIELNIAETEEGIDFYKSKGYEQEGALSNHYRWGETCFILSKSFSNKSR